MWKRKQRRGPGPLGVLMALAATGMVFWLVRNVLPDVRRYSRMHRM